MYNYFIYKNGSNPYVSMNNKNLFKMIIKYNLTQFENDAFFVDSPRKCDAGKTYKVIQSILQEFAQVWQNDFCKFVYDYKSLSGFEAFFTEYGKKYGLLREFRENGII